MIQMHLHLVLGVLSCSFKVERAMEGQEKSRKFVILGWKINSVVHFFLPDFRKKVKVNWWKLRFLTVGVQELERKSLEGNGQAIKNSDAIANDANGHISRRTVTIFSLENILLIGFPICFHHLLSKKSLISIILWF